MNIRAMTYTYRMSKKPTMSQRDLADKLGVSQAWVSEVETGKRGINQMRPEHRGALLGLLGFTAKAIRPADLVSRPDTRPSEDIPPLTKETIMGFQTYKPEFSPRASSKEAYARVSPAGTITLSKALTEAAKVSKEVRYEFAWNAETNQVGLTLLPNGEGSDSSRAFNFADSGSVSLNVSKPFRHFRIETPAASTKLPARLVGSMIVIDYPEILVAR